MNGEVVMSCIVPVHPHPLLAPEKNEGWGKLRNSFDELRDRIDASEADLILIYSTTWPSIIGHQIQADPNPVWTLVDADFHDLGSMPYDFKIDSKFAEIWNSKNKERGLTSRTIAYNGFPIDVGSVVALSLLNPDNRIPAVIVSSNIYSNRSETIVLAKACLDAIKETGRKVVVVSATSMSNRMFTEYIEPNEDRIHSLKDDEWNRKILEFLDEGRLEDVSQLSRQIHEQIRVQKVVSFKPMWFLSGINGQTNNLTGEVLAYEALHGAGGAVVQLLPSPSSAEDKEYDEDDVDYYSGDRDVLDSTDDGEKVSNNENSNDRIHSDSAPKPVGAYPHARREGDLLYLSGVGPRKSGDDSIPGGAISDDDGNPQEYDIKAQTRAVIENVRVILEDAGSSLNNIIDVTSFLIDMDRDFQGYNEVWTEKLGEIGITRTTLAIKALPTPIAVEMKVIAKAY